MSVVRVVWCLAGFTVWRVLAVAGLVLLVLVPPSPSPPSSLQQTRRCDSKLSSVARRIIHQFSPEVRLPYQCPLHPLRDVFGQVELAKLHYRVNLWTCAQCGKSFSGELELETHLHHRHPGLADRTDFTVCLADWCDVLRCHLQQERVSRRPWPVRQEAQEAQQVARAPSRELVALLETADTGLAAPPPPSCSSGDCLADHGQTGRARQRRYLSQHQHHHHNQTQCTDCFRNNCSPTKMAELKQRCEILVDSCLSPLALQLTDKELLELREKIEAELCSFLTCDRYWSMESGRNNVNIAALLLVLATTASLYLIFVYQLVWHWY